MEAETEEPEEDSEEDEVDKARRPMSQLGHVQSLCFQAGAVSESGWPRMLLEGFSQKPT